MNPALKKYLHLTPPAMTAYEYLSRVAEHIPSTDDGTLLGRVELALQLPQAKRRSEMESAKGRNPNQGHEGITLLYAEEHFPALTQSHEFRISTWLFDARARTYIVNASTLKHPMLCSALYRAYVEDVQLAPGEEIARFMSAGIGSRLDDSTRDAIYAASLSPGKDRNFHEIVKRYVASEA